MLEEKGKRTAARSCANSPMNPSARISSPRRSRRLHLLKEKDPLSLSGSSSKNAPKLDFGGSPILKICRRSARLNSIAEKRFEPDDSGSDSDSSAGIMEEKSKKRETWETPEIKKVERKKMKPIKGLKVCEGAGISEWSYEQEMALRDAYVLAKPSPHFWKKVSKMVPGKSAQECFDRMHSKMATPAQLPPRSKSKISAAISPLPCSNLFSKHPKKTKEGRNKDVRRILRKHSAVDSSQDADLFSVLEEPSQNAFPEILIMHPKNELFGNSPSPSVPKRETEMKKKKKKNKNKKKNEKGLSRFSELSPEVLRPVKNIVLHERYVDRLHGRVAKRQMHSGNRMHCAGKENEVNFAKTALISEAKEFINRFGCKLADPLRNYNVGDEGEEEEEEEEDLDQSEKA